MVRYFTTLEPSVGERMLPVLARALDMPAGPLRAVLRRRGARQPALPALSAAGDRRRRAVRPGAAHRQLVHHRSWRGPTCPASRCGCRAASGWPRRWSSGHLPGQPGQHDEALVERPLPLDAARRAERHGRRPLLDRLLLQPESRARASSACRAASAADNPPRYPPAVYRDLVLEFYNANYFHRAGNAKTAAPLPPDPARRRPRSSYSIRLSAGVGPPADPKPSRGRPSRGASKLAPAR